MIKESYYYYYYYYSASRRLSAIAERAILRGRPPRNPTPAGILAMAHCLSVPVCLAGLWHRALLNVLLSWTLRE